MRSNIKHRTHTWTRCHHIEIFPAWAGHIETLALLAPSLTALFTVHFTSLRNYSGILMIHPIHHYCCPASLISPNITFIDTDNSFSILKTKSELTIHRINGTK